MCGVRVQQGPRGIREVEAASLLLQTPRLHSARRALNFPLLRALPSQLCDLPSSCAGNVLPMPLQQPFPPFVLCSFLIPMSLHPQQHCRGEKPLLAPLFPTPSLATFILFQRKTLSVTRH